jgi:SNF family Na+-dependent transporter
MKHSKLILISFLDALGTTVYIIGVAFIIKNGEKIFGKMDNFFGPIAFLLLFVLSAAITGSLVLGRPIILYFETKKIEAVKLFLYTLGWLFLITLIVFVVQISK